MSVLKCSNSSYRILLYSLLYVCTILVVWGVLNFQGLRFGVGFSPTALGGCPKHPISQQHSRAKEEQLAARLWTCSWFPPNLAHGTLKGTLSVPSVDGFVVRVTIWV